MAPSPLERIEAHQKRIDDAQLIPDDVPLLEIADSVVRGKRKLSQQQARVLIELLPYNAHKLTAVAVGHFQEGTFADLLDRAIARSQASMKHIEAAPVSVPEREQHPREELRGPFPKLRRRI